MNKHDKMVIKSEGLRLFYEVERHPDKFFPVLGCHLNSQTLFGKLIRWWERGDASHLKTTYIHKATGLPFVDVHALEGWGYIASEPEAFVKDGCVCEYRIIRDHRPVEELIAIQRKRLPCKYQRPFGFITKSRKDNPDKWFCSEDADDLHDLQNCESVFVSPPWGRRSDKCRIKYGTLSNGHFELHND